MNAPTNYSSCTLDHLGLVAGLYDKLGISHLIDQLILQKLDQRTISLTVPVLILCIFHGTLDSGKQRVRAWVILWNFCPSSPITVKKYGGKLSPAERLNGMCYADNWIENLLISASINAFRASTESVINSHFEW